MQSAISERNRQGMSVESSALGTGMRCCMVPALIDREFANCRVYLPPAGGL
jgi:hypothetical protein